MDRQTVALHLAALLGHGPLFRRVGRLVERDVRVQRPQRGAVVAVGRARAPERRDGLRVQRIAHHHQFQSAIVHAPERRSCVAVYGILGKRCESRPSGRARAFPRRRRVDLRRAVLALYLASDFAWRATRWPKLHRRLRGRHDRIVKREKRSLDVPTPAVASGGRGAAAARAACCGRHVAGARRALKAPRRRGAQRRARENDARTHHFARQIPSKNPDYCSLTLLLPSPASRVGRYMRLGLPQRVDKLWKRLRQITTLPLSVGWLHA